MRLLQNPRLAPPSGQFSTRYVRSRWENHLLSRTFTADWSSRGLPQEVKRDDDVWIGGFERDQQPAPVTRTYLCPRRDQMFLLPVSMREWIPEGHLAWLVLDVVAEMDTSGLHQGPCVVSGRPPYEPEMMCALVLYAYCRGIRSSRRSRRAV